MNTIDKPTGSLLALFALLAAACAAEPTFTDRFDGRLGEGWSWVREQPNAWRVSQKGLEIRVLPGNMWGPANNAKNVLVRPLPDPASHPVTVTLRLENRPTEQYEQVDLVWYYDDSHMVKIGQELVDGKLSLVMGREEADRTRTIAIIPIAAHPLEVRFRAEGARLRGQYRAAKDSAWTDAGECALPVNGAPKASIQCYQGPTQSEHWALLSEFRVEQTAP